MRRNVALFSTLWALLTCGMPSVAESENLYFTRHKAIDTGVTGRPAASYLIPKGWKAEDTVQWQFFQQDSPLLEAFRVTSPDGKDEINFVNNLPHWYTHIPSTSAAKSQGTPPPQRPGDVFIEAFKAMHPGVTPQILTQTYTPAQSIFKPAATQKTQAYNCLLKLRYPKDGLAHIVEYAFEYQAYDSGTAWGFSHGFWNGHWYVSDVMSVGAPETEFDRAMRLAVITLSSRRDDPVFHELYRSVCNAITLQNLQLTAEKLKRQFEETQNYFKDLAKRNKRQFDEDQERKSQFTQKMCDFELDRSRWTDGESVFYTPMAATEVMTDGSEIMVEFGPHENPRGHWDDLKRID